MKQISVENIFFLPESQISKILKQFFLYLDKYSSNLIGLVTYCEGQFGIYKQALWNHAI